MTRQQRPKHRKSFNWYGLSQRFSIRKYHFGATSVLLGTALIVGAAQTTAKAEEVTAENKTEAVASTPKDDKTNKNVANVTTPALSATTEATVVEKPTLSDDEIAKLAAEASKKDEKASKPATTEKTEAADKEKATLTTPSTDKKADKAVDEKADKEDEKKAENPVTATKTVLEQLTSEAEVLNTTASNFADKKAEDKAGKEAIAAAVASAKVQIKASKIALLAGEITKEELDAQVQRISSAIEAVYAEMKRAGHVGKVEAVLDDVAANNNKLVVKPAQVTPVANYKHVTEEEIAEIIRQFRIANPDLTDADKIQVNVNGNLVGETTVTLANGQKFTFPTSEVIKGYTANRNTEQLKKSINWFDFGSSKITYTDGTKVGEVKHLATPVTKVVRDRYGVEQTGVFTYYREVTYPDGRKGTTLDDEWLKNGPARYSKHFYNDGRAQNMNGRDASSRGEFFEALQEGMKFTVKTSVEGYELTATVTSLAPKNVATNPFKDSNGKAYNVMNKDQTSTGRRAGDPVDVVLAYQDKTYSHMKHVGLSTDNEDGTPQMTAFTAAYDSANVGVNFSLSATYNSRPVAVNAIAVDAEEAGEIEVLQFETDGTNWEQFLTLNKNPKGGNGVVPINSELLGRNNNSFERPGYKRTEWLSTDKNGNVSMYGTKLFGPAWTTINSGNDLPVGLSQNVSNLSIYMNTQGSQAGTIGFVIYDGGDAPASYGSAQHFIGNLVRTNSDGSNTVATQPYLGSQKGDPDFRTTEKEPSGAWVLDDLVNTDKYEKVELKSGTSTVTNEKGDTGIYEVQRNGNTVIRKTDGTTVALRQDDILTISDPTSHLPIKGVFNKAEGVIGVGVLADEGEGQLLDPAVATTYALRQGTANEYELKGVRANPGTNNEKAYVRGWVDFNNNGKFDLYEASELVEVTKEGTYTLKWKNTPQLLDTSVDSLGVRLRIALDKGDLDLPTGVAASGEVEDFQTHVVHPPRGTRNESKDFQGRDQKLDIRTTELFTATGKTESSKYSAWNQMEPTVAPKFVLTDTVVASEEPTANTTVNVTDPEGTTVYKGAEVVVKDKRGNTLGTAVKVVNPATGKTEYYLSQYTEYDTAGNKVGEYTLNKNGQNGQNIKDATGNYRTTVDFHPEPGYVGTARGAVIRGWDQNRNSTGWDLTDATLKEALASDRLADKDKLTENVNKEYNGNRTMDAVYIPTVIDVRPVGEDTITEDVQGATQKSNPTIPVYGTVETVTNDKVEDVRYTTDYVILDKTKKPTFATRKEIPGKFYRQDTKVTEPTTITLDDGTQATFAPKTLPAGTPVFENDKTYTITGTGNVTLKNVNYGGGTVPAGAKVMSKEPTTVEPTTVIRDGAQVVVPTGQKLKVGDVLVTPLTIRGEAQRSFWEITYNKGDRVPGNRVQRNPDITLANDTTVDQLIGGSETEFTAANGKTYSKNSVDTIPAGTREQTTYEDLMNVTLPNAVHIDPQTGEVTSVPRRYTKVTETEIVIENEGTYTLNQDTGEITFTPDPKFVGTGTGVTKQQPDVDYNDKVAGDSVTSKYGTDFGKATYTPIVKPQSKASITRTIHYVYENGNDNPSSQDSYKDNNPILAIDNTPVTRTQTIDYTRDYQIFSEAGATGKEMVTTNQVTDASGHVYKVGDTIPAGTKFNQGSIIIGKWTASSDENSKFKEIISPTVKGYTAEVVTADFTSPGTDGKMGHIHNGKQPVGLYTPVADNTKDVGAYEPLVSEVRSDDKDDFDMYVVYKADTQKAKVTYIDLDATGDARILEVQTAATAPATGADAKTTYGVTTLQGKSHTAIPYTTAETIKKYEDQGYELVTDDYTNNTQGTAIEGGRKFDDDKEVDQAFNVYLRHKKVIRQIKDTQEVTRTIEYKYASTDDVPADKRGTTAAPTVTETLHFERDRTIDYTLAAKEYPTEYATYKAVLDKSGYDSPEEYKARTVYYDHITNKAIAADATAAQKAIVTFGPWTPVGGTSNDAITLSDAEKAKDDKFNLVNSPEVTGYTPDNATVEATAAIDAEADDYKITVLYTPVDQKAVVKFVEVDPTNTDKVITPGLAEPISVTGKSEATYPATTATSVTDKIAELVKKGYELVDNGFVSTDKFDKDAAVDQEYVVKFKAKVVDIPSFDPTKPASNDNPKPTPGVTPIDPNNPDGPKWTEALINAVKVQEEVTRTIKYVYEDGTPVAESDLTSVADKKVKTLKFTRSGKINVATGEITYGDWSADQTFEAVTSPTLEKYTAAVAGVTPVVADVPMKTVAATDKDFEETVIYSTKPTTVDPNKPTDPTNPNVTPQPDDVVPNDPKGRTYRELGLIEEVTHTVHYKLEDGSDAGIADNVQTLTFTRTAEVDLVTGAISNYGTWKAKGGDTTIDAVTTPNKDGYVASAKTSTERTNVAATDKDSEETIIYRKLGSYVPVVPEGVTPPADADLNPKPYPNATPEDPTKPGTPTETPVVPYIPGTTPVGPNGKPLTPKDPNDPTKGYEVPSLPTDPTQNTTITYVKDGSQVAVTHFIEVNSETDKTEKGAVAESVVDTGDTGKAFTKSADITSTIEALKAKGYTVVENNYPTDGKFDADSKTNQVYKVLVTAKPITVNPNDPTPTKDQPIDPNNPTGPKWTPELIKELEDGRKEEVKRTIKYVYADGSKAADSVQETKEFKRSATINPVTGKITFGDWSPAQTFEAVTSPTVTNFTPDKETVPASEVTATAEDINETVIYTTKPTNVDPNKPVDPNTPDVTPKPDDKVPNDPKGRTYKELGLIEEVTHTVHYKLADGSDAGIADNVQTLTFTRTADLDPVTGALSNFSDWKAKGDDTTIDAVTTPNKPGYVASAATSTARENVKATDKDSEETIIYRKLGSYVPVIPEGVTPPEGTDLTPKPYENPTNEDPTKPGTPAETPVVPYIPGTTPVGPDGKPLTPKDPNDPTKGYEVPKVPEDPTQNTTITYVKDGSQVALVHFIKADGTAVHVSVAEAGDTGKAIKTTNIDNVKAELEAKGYEVVAPTDASYTAERVAFYAEANRTFDDKDDKGNDGISQVYYVIVKEGITPIDPDKPLDPNTPGVTPKPGDKVPGDPKQRTFEQLGLLDEVNRTINYRYANTDKVEEAKRGQEAAATVEQKLRYSRKGDLNKVTGEITYTSDWTAPQTLAEVTSPVIEGYVADIKAAEKVDNVAHDAADSVVNVVYTPLGKYVPKVPEGFEEPKLDKPQYPNDPTDPTKPGTPTTVIPHVPGTTPKDPNGNPLKPVDPNDPSKGYVPPTPENPTEDTEITYEKDTQKATVTYVVEGTGTVLHTDNLEGKSGEPIEYSTVAKLAELKALGYDLVSDGFTTATDKNFDKDTTVDQSFVVTVKPHVEPINPVDPENPNDPNKPKPGDPIDPNNPDGPKWTEDLIKQIDTTRHVNRTITYVNEKGEEVAKKVTDKVTFTREGKINSVTGEITYGNWTAKDGDTTFEAVTSPVVKGYILKDAKQKEVAATTGLTADSKDENIEVVYTKLGSWVPKVPEGITPIDPTPYPNDPNDPTKPGNDKPIVPYVPGTTPVVPKDPTKPISPDNPLVPLTPVDPKDPSKGYEVPPVPTDPSTDTPITYVTDKQKAITNFVTESGKVVSTPVVDEGDSGANFTKSKVDEVTKTIEKLEKAGYRVVKNDFPSKDTDRVFDKDKSVDQIFNVTVAERIIPVTPGKPVDPNDPNLPKNPDGTPVTPSTPEPGKPVFPNDPNSPVWPSTVKDLVTEKSATRTIKYVDRNGQEVSETRVETIKFTRDAKVNLVTGEITYGEWTTDRNDDIFNGYPVPVVKGYIAKAGDLESSTKDVKVTPDTIKDINETVVYDKLGSWVPNIPGTPTNPIPYPNDPKDPTKPGSDKPHVPYVPGFTPVDPNGNPLKPVDPNDPTKGYEVPNVPNDPTKDTPINYVPVPQPNPTPAPTPKPEPKPEP
ncbi:mucin-binding protein, partial [Streptococcus vestibularis]|uniref:mucin-binding protein n=1 Tax=Streptococcus vestibularis TaxID=1343 RepID=UPI0012B854BD